MMMSTCYHLFRRSVVGTIGWKYSEQTDGRALNRIDFFLLLLLYQFEIIDSAMMEYVWKNPQCCPRRSLEVSKAKQSKLIYRVIESTIGYRLNDKLRDTTIVGELQE